MERILGDPEETCVFMAPAITGSFGTGSSGNCVQNENYNYNIWRQNDLIFVFLYNIHYVDLGAKVYPCKSHNAR